MSHEKYHYLECGLDDVYLVNGFERKESPRGAGIAIRDIDKLHRAIGEYLCLRKKELTGREVRFLRREMLMSQSTLAHLLDVGEQTVHRWENGKSNMPRAAEALLRLMYNKDTAEGVRDQLNRIADLEDELDHKQQMTFELMGSNRRGEWKLAA